VPGFLPRLRDIAAAVDPALQLHELRSAADAEREVRLSMQYLAFGVLGVTLAVLLLSAAGIYAMMSFTVTRRRREIGIRAALGANPRRVLVGIFARAGAQIGGGVVAGVLLAAGILAAAGGQLLGRLTVFLFVGVAGLMTVVGLMAALGPARRGLAVEPTEALRAD
jgi:ABC-type antimicrobial peptide transport system permease subunit